MPTITVHVLNAFVENGEGGNRAGVVLDAEALTRDQKQAIAAEMALSETAFVLPSRRADFRVEFFTPNRQVPHCGHATLATYHILARTGHVTCNYSSKESVEDLRRITYHADGIFMEQKKPAYRPAPDLDRALAAVGLDREELHAGADPAVVSTGNPWLLFGLPSETALAAVTPDHDAIAAWCKAADAVGLYLFAPAPEGADYHAGVRMFAPLFGVPEESATGSAAGPLACYLFERVGGMPREIVIRQGHLMMPPSPSRIRCRLNVVDGAVQNLMVGGEATLAGTREVTVP